MWSATDLKDEWECKKCGNCCKHYPCPLLPEDLPIIAKHFGLSEEEVFKKYFCIDYWIGDGEEAYEQYYVCPERKTAKFLGRKVSFGWGFEGMALVFEDKEGKKISSYTPPESACIFLTSDNLCSIYEVRPSGAREASCHSKNNKSKKWYASRWKDHWLIEKYKNF